MPISRRGLLQRSGLLAGVPFVPFIRDCSDLLPPSTPPGARDYGPLVPGDGKILSLPEGFRYVVISPAGATMSDGNLVPRFHDGMHAYPVPGKPHCVRLVRNHEISGVGQSVGAPGVSYDPTGTGAVTIVEWDTRSEQVVRHFLALSGTIENCAGGAGGPGLRSWLSCEENTAGLAAGYARPHGYVFEVPSGAEGIVQPIPLKDMGRFTHEAAVTDPHTGHVYLTEDEGPDGFYRFIPVDRDNLCAGGSLWMLAVDGSPKYDTSTGQVVARVLPVHWVRIDDPDPTEAEDNPSAVFEQGLARGAAKFAGLEGAFFARGKVFFVASEGGEAERGQIWKYTPVDHARGLLELVYESVAKEALDGPDNICVSPRGALVLCEDGDGEEWIDSDDSCRVGGDSYVRAISPEGHLFDLAKVAEPLDLVALDPEEFEEDCLARPLPGPGEVFGVSETCGAVFSPDGQWLFINVQYPGVTLAITGPWHKGPI